ncbi:MAG: M50 family metallopeptidase [Planctomycetes bacterium]|nr:M50 family metallopeptidase [Planctomycetota bacterium]
MNERLNWMLPSFELFRIGSLQVRLSLFFLPLAPLFLIRLGWSLGLIVLGLLVLSVFLHEVGHVCLARLTGGTASEIHLSPMGGLAMVQAGRGTWSQVVTTAAGPFVNLVICCAVFPTYYAPTALWGILNPLELPISRLHEDRIWQDLGLIVFSLNWMLLVFNLLPILPMDGGRIVRTLLLTRIHPELVDRRAMQVSMIAAGLVALGGLFGDWSAVVFLGAVLLIVNLVQYFENESVEREDDSFLGYDFSEGYTSLDRSAPAGSTQSAEAQRGLLDQWRERRRQNKEQALRRQQEEAEQQLDELLAKVHAQGMGSLTPREQQLLKQVSDLLRERGKRPS